LVRNEAAETETGQNMSTDVDNDVIFVGTMLDPDDFDDSNDPSGSKFS